MSNLINAENTNGVLTITINRADKKNAFTEAMYADLATLFSDAASDQSLHVVILTGGRDFSAGNDLVDFLNAPPQETDAAVFRFMRALAECPIPVIAAVDGFAVGIGTTLLPHCDFVYCTDRSLFMLPFINLAVRPEFGSSQIFPLLAGHARAAEIIMLGEKFDAQTAKEIGLVNAVLSPEELQPKALEVANKLVKKDRASLLETKALLRRDIEPMAARIAQEAELFRASLNQPQAKAAFAALLKK